MQSDVIVQKMSRSMGKMKLCGLYCPEKVQNSGPKQGPVRTLDVQILGFSPSLAMYKLHI